MKYVNLIVWLIGVGLIVLLSVLASGWFEDSRIVYLDGGALICAYSILIYVYSGLYYNSTEFARDVPAAGIRIPVLWLYTGLVVLGIAIGYYARISFSWQALYQLCFLFLMVIGLLLGNASAEHLQSVADRSMQRQQAKEQLVALAQQLSIASSLSTNVDMELRVEIKKLCERTSYISPSSSPAAKVLENSLGNTIKQILESLDVAEKQALIPIVERANNILSQRIKTY